MITRQGVGLGGPNGVAQLFARRKDVTVTIHGMAGGHAAFRGRRGILRCRIRHNSNCGKILAASFVIEADGCPFTPNSRR